MLTFLIGKKQRAIAWFFFIIFYTDIIGAAYASNKMYAPIITFTNHSSGGHTYNNYTSEPPKIEAHIVRKNDLAKKPITLNDQLKNIPDFAKNLIPVTPNIELNKLSNKLDSAGPGPGQPEMSSFKSVGADNMVNLFTGDFSYNIPLLDVDGYPVNIFYNAGPSMDQEASWVGLGWNINPGTINRNMRGLPDDFNGVDKVTKEMTMKPDITVGVNASRTKELVGVPLSSLVSASVSTSVSAGVFYNSKRGIGMELGVSGDFSATKKLSKKNGDNKTTKDTVKFLSAGAGAGFNLNSQTGLTPTLTFQASISGKDKNTKSGLSTSIDFNSRSGLGALQINGEIPTYSLISKGVLKASESNHFSTTISFARTSYTPSIRIPMTSFNATFTGKFGREKKINFKSATSISGYYSKSSIANKYKTQTKPAYGYMYYEDANIDKNALLDFNRLNDGSYTYKTPIISIPVYTYDVFTITGEGTGGSFRGFRGNMGYVRDPYTRTNSGKMNLQLDLGAQSKVHGGSVLNGVYSNTTVEGWNNENDLKTTAEFQRSERDVQKGFYFKNPGEKAIIDEDYYNKMGKDKMMRPVMGDPGSNLNIPPFYSPKISLKSEFQLYNARKVENGILPVDAATSYREKRDKRTQVISYLTAKDADKVGLDKYIAAYPENVFKPGACPGDYGYKQIIRRTLSGVSSNDNMYRKDNHISEITVQEGSKRYVYGLPVYQTKQVETTLSVDGNKVLDAKGLVSYSAVNQTQGNNKEGKDGLFQRETVPAFAHSFLLTAILSPDYSDIDGNGISDDDLGTAIKFNYSRPYNNSANSIKWRMPVEESKANLNKGLLTDDQDNKALTTYGEKELWYMHSIESKNMVATFTVSKREDGYGVLGIDGGKNDATNAACQRKLDRIDLYSKADFIYAVANNKIPKPIKTVHFTYTYKLCKNYNLYSGSAAKGNGKLTLESIYFTYNNNNHQKNKYLFKYAEQEDASTATYDSRENDRWGTYKPHTQNPNGVQNEDYPYTNQNKAQSDVNAATWSLNKILLPSGARIDINYEADDYAYVQNKRAAQMTNILGFGGSTSAAPGNFNLYNPLFAAPWYFVNSDFRYVFFENTLGATNTAEVARYYLQDIKQLLLKLWVKVPKSAYGLPGYEPIFVYCNIDDFGVVPNSNRFYVKVGKAARNNGSQIMETVYQFLRDQLPGKAYPGSDIGNSSAVKQIVLALFAMVNNLRTGVTGFENNARLDRWCKEVDPALSTARLCNPNFKKIGGGHRVKSIKISDNWKKMLTKAGEPALPEIDSYYGQEYEYTTSENVNGLDKTISSGVASYEPGVGNDENPFREILQYGSHNTLGPTENSNIELPIAETFFPSPSIGYSRVKVKSIHGKNSADPANNKNIKSGVGMQETNFYTTKDFPTVSEYTDLGPKSRHHFKPSAINKIFKFAQKDYMSITQGFRVVLNDMNGKMKTQASYAETDLKNPINKTSYYYRINKYGENKYRLNNIVPTVSGPDGKITNKLIGKDIEVMNDFREHLSTTRSAQVPLNMEFFTQQIGQFVIPIIIPTVFKMAFRDESLFRSATTLKIVNEYGILDSVENFDKGSLVGTKNLVYNAETGDVMVSRTQNEFNKPIYNFSYPAYWAVDDMGPAYKNIDATFTGLTFRHGKIDAGLTEDEVNKYFASGDEIFISNTPNAVKEHTACETATCGTATILPLSIEPRLWALDVTKDTRNTHKEFTFIDRNGNPYNAENANIRIIRSGRRNMMDASVGSITSMANPILLDVNNNYDKIAISNTTDVVNSGAMEYKEKWKVQDAFWVEEKLTTVTRYAPVGNPITLSPIKSYTYMEGNGRPCNSGCGNNPFYDHTDNNFAFSARKNYKFINGIRRTFINYEEKSWILFDLDQIGNTKVKRASLSLYSHSDYPAPFTQPHVFPRRGFLNHYNFNSHDSRYPPDNDFELSRMKMNVWPGPNSPLWRANFFTGNYNEYDHLIKQGPWVNYQSGSSDYANSNKIEVGKIVQGMINDKYDLTKQYQTAFRISLPQPFQQAYANSSEHEARVCFNNYWGLGNVGDRLKPKLELATYNCANALPVGYPLQTNVEYGECITTQKEIICHSVFDGNFVNPYVRGLLGNWRPLKSYVYYGERREQDPTVASTNIAKDGIIKDFEPFWAFDVVNNKQITKTNSIKWTWNSEITQYNRKGAELENKDPLERYNASIYGYNEALPVAVVNNSKLRQSAFDGFEDYNFKDQTCGLDCNPNKRHFDTKLNIFQLSEEQAHSGKYSLKTDNNTTNTTTTSIKIKMSADNNALDANTPDLRIGITKTNTTVNGVTLKGIGLKGRYQNGAVFERLDPIVWLNYSFRRRDNPDAQATDPSGNPIPLPYPLEHWGGNSVNWTGKLQVVESGEYFFNSSEFNDEVFISIGGTIVYRNSIRNRCNNFGSNNSPLPITLQSGILYDVNISFCDRYSRPNGGHVDFSWRPACENNFRLVPTLNMYPDAAAANGSINPSNYICTKVSVIKPLSNFLIDGFNLTYNKKMVASVWVKKGTVDCRCPLYDGFSMTLKTGTGMSSQVLATFAAKSPIIEGWQLFETEFTVPNTGDELEFFIDNVGNDAAVYVDDLRFHPYNSNMKSFVYNPYNLKPAAELDENNYATFYEYDDDGTLIRVKKETKLGIKTIQETRSSLQKSVTDF
jgi:hypothetical protein